MAYKADYKTTFEPARVIKPIYTGGSVSLSQDGNVLASTLGEEALLTNLNTGAHLAQIEGDGEALTTLAITPDASFLILCSRSLSVRIYALRSEPDEDEIEATLVRTLKPHSTPVVTVAIDATGTLLATGGAEGEIKIWDIRGGFVTHTFHGHSGVVSALRFFEVEMVAESTTQTSTKRKKGQKVTSESRDLNNAATVGLRLASGAEDGKIRIWDLHKRKSIATLESHISVVRGLDYSTQRNLLLSASRDKTAILWDARTWQPAATIAVLEGTEAAGFIEHGNYFYTGGETARLRVWSSEVGAEVTLEQEEGTEVEAILDVQYHPGLPFLLSVHADQTLILRSLLPLSAKSITTQIEPLPVLRRISGTHDEVIDLAYVGAHRNLLALATNLEDIRIISLDTDRQKTSDDHGTTPYFGADVALLKGHSEIVITIDTDWSGHWLATGAKDNLAKLWRLDPENESYSCYATFTGHAESISAVSLPNAAPVLGSRERLHPLEHPPKFLVTGSSDKTIKRWDIISTAGKAPRAAYTRKAHDKDINAIETSFSAAAPLFASASQDRTVRIWDANTGEAVGVLRGHKRGVWSVAFSPPDMPSLTTGESGGASTARGMIVTGSGDKTVRIWSLTDYSCLRTFEGHTNSILKVIWMPAPKQSSKNKSIQVASAAGDGLVKIWDAQTSECAATLDNHIDRVWALAVKPAMLDEHKEASASTDVDEMEEDDDWKDQSGDSEPTTLVSGSADSTLTFWTDTTAITAARATTQMTARVEQDQNLQNLIRANSYREAIVLALQLDHPRRLLEIFTAMIRRSDGEAQTEEVIAQLSDSQLWTLLRRLRDWNANARTARVAQKVLNTILRSVGKERLLALRKRRPAQPAEQDLVDGMQEVSLQERSKGKSKESVKDVLDALKAYTERHHARQEKAGEELFVLTWILQSMDDVSGTVNASLTNGANGHGHDDVFMLGDGDDE